MNHCLIITVYKDVENLNRLISRCPANWGIYVHLDRKSKISAAEINPRAKVFGWYRIYWGAYEHILAIFHLIQCAQDDADWDFYHIISGQDYFASAPSEFDTICKAEQNYIAVESLPNAEWRWDKGEGLLFKYKHLSSLFDVRRPFFAYLDSAFVKIQKIFSIQCSIPEYPIFRGMVWCSLSGSFVKWMLRSAIAKDLLKRLRSTLVGEEVFFQTIIMNSPYRDSIVANNLHYYKWQDGPKVLTEEDYDGIALCEERYLFCRKIDSKYSASLLELFDKS